MKAGAAAAAAGVSVKALRYYERLGLIEPSRQVNGYRDYTEDDVRLTLQVRAVLDLGLTAAQARPFLDCLRAGHGAGDECPESLATYQAHLDQLDGLIAHLARIRGKVAAQLSTAAQLGFGSRDVPPRQDSNEGWAAGSDPLPRPQLLPEDLPIPVDDGAAAHLPGRHLPSLVLTATGGEQVPLDNVSTRRWVLYVYPLTGDPRVDVPRGWDAIPGARGCSQEACSFRDSFAALRAAGVEQVLALSSDRSDYQTDLVARLRLPYPMLSDPTLSLAKALGLPTFTTGVEGLGAMTGSAEGEEREGVELYKRLTLVIDHDRIEHVFYPVFPPERHAEEVLDCLRQHPADRP